MDNFRPAGITLNRETGHLLIHWSDGKHCAYPLSLIREACPCVECSGGHENMGMQKNLERASNSNLISLTPARSYQVENIELVGNYALQLFWDDGHHTGIYRWEYLYNLCPE